MVRRTVTELFLESAKERLNSARDDEFAAALNIGKSTIASWRLRNAIPKERIKQIEELTGVTFEEITKYDDHNFRITPFVEELSNIGLISSIADYLRNREVDYALTCNMARAIPFAQKLLQERINKYLSSRPIDGVELTAIARACFSGQFLSPTEFEEFTARPSSPMVRQSP